MGGMELMRAERLAVMLEEIEACLSGHPGVQRAAVVEQGERLVAYVSAAANETLEEEQLRTYLKGLLPAFKIPRYFVLLQAMPLAPDGSVDRSALPDPQALQAGADTGKLAQASGQPGDRVDYLVGLWAQLLGCKAEPGDNFFDLGGHSMLAVQMANRVHRDTGVRIQLMTLATQSLAQIAATLPARVDTPSAGLGSRFFGKFKGILQGQERSGR